MLNVRFCHTVQCGVIRGSPRGVAPLMTSSDRRYGYTLLSSAFVLLLVFCWRMYFATLSIQRRVMLQKNMNYEMCLVRKALTAYFFSGVSVARLICRM